MSTENERGDSLHPAGSAAWWIVGWKRAWEKAIAAADSPKVHKTCIRSVRAMDMMSDEEYAVRFGKRQNDKMSHSAGSGASTKPQGI